MGGELNQVRLQAKGEVGEGVAQARIWVWS